MLASSFSREESGSPIPPGTPTPSSEDQKETCEKPPVAGARRPVWIPFESTLSPGDPLRQVCLQAARYLEQGSFRYRTGIPGRRIVSGVQGDLAGRERIGAEFPVVGVPHHRVDLS